MAQPERAQPEPVIRGSMDSERNPPAWIGLAVLLAIGAYVILLGIGVIGVLFDIQPILDGFARLSP